MTATFFEGDARVVLREFPPDFFHCAMTSPPYFGLRSYDGGQERWDDGWFGQLGAEPTPELYIQHLIQIMREIRRVLRFDGVFWLNIGDSWAGGKGQSGGPKPEEQARRNRSGVSINRECDNFGTGHGVTRTLDNRAMLRESGIKPLDMVLIPEQLALAARADGWYVRSVLIWAKGVSLSDEYNGNPMPESVNGWRWERHRVRLQARTRGSNEGSMPPQSHHAGQVPHRDGSFNRPSDTVWGDCLGCPKCEPNGGYVLRKGSWRPTDSYEHVLMLTKTNSYFCDREAVLERDITGDKRRPYGSAGAWELDGRPEAQRHGGELRDNGGGGRNLRSVLAVPTAGSKIKHFATFPPRLVTPLIKAATSEKGCCSMCGSPWARVVERGSADHDGSTTTSYSVGENANRIALLRQAARERGEEYVNRTETVGWLPTCSCSTQHDPVPCWVLDPFCGSGTVSLVCERLGLDSVGIDTSAKYIQFSEDRIAEDAPKRGVGD